MNAKRRLFAIILTLATATAGLAQEYQLGWDQINEGSTAKEKAYTLNWEDVSTHVDRSTPQPEVELAPEMPEKGKVAMMSNASSQRRKVR